MRVTKLYIKVGCLMWLGVLSLYSFADVTVLYKEDFESPTLPKSANANFQALDTTATLAISTDKTLNHNGSAGSIRANYPAPIGSGGYYVWGGFTPVQRDLMDVYVEFWAKMPSTTKHGLKFLKIFGQRDSDVYANTTFGLDYTGVDNGGMYCVSFGDGSTTGNDTANIIMFSGESPQQIGRSYGKAVVSLPQKAKWGSSNWGTTWHRFRFHFKFNSGTSSATEVADGEYYVEIDGKVYVNATGLFNRHYLNKPIDHIEFFGWSQTGTSPFEIWYDDIVISTGGFTTDPVKPAPIPPPNYHFQ